MILIPNEKGQFVQTNLGEISGNIWASWNLDLLSNPGRIRVSPQTQILMSNDNNFAYKDSDFGLPVAFIRTSAASTEMYWTVAGSALFYTSKGASSIGPGQWVQDTLSSTPTTDGSDSDMVEFNGALLVSTSDNIARLSTTWNATWWTTTIGGSTLGAVPHPLCVGFNNLMLVGNGNVIASTDINGTFSNAKITLGKEYEIQWIRSSNSAYYVGARSKVGGRGKIFTWDGYSANFTQDYKLYGVECYSGFIKNEICYTIDETGALYAFVGAGFTPVAYFPSFSIYQKLSGSFSRNCMAVIRWDIHILMPSALRQTNGTFGVESMRSGIWCFNAKTGLHHRYSITKDTGSGLLDYGSPSISAVGALFLLGNTFTSNFLAGAAVVPDGSGAEYNYLVNNLDFVIETTSKFGYLITPKIHTKNIEEEWQKVVIQFKKLLNSTDKIIVKYRIDKTNILEDGDAALGTWSDTDTFTSTADLSEVSAGDEVEIIVGEGSGLSAHISSISEAGGTYTVNLDETTTGASGSIRFQVFNWTKAGDDFSTQGLRFVDFPIGANSSWIQFKICMWWQGLNEVERIIIYSKPKVKI